MKNQHRQNWVGVEPFSAMELHHIFLLVVYSVTCQTYLRLSSSGNALAGLVGTVGLGGMGGLDGVVCVI